jgi:16S rRNA (uracil1498-N3)-methyltransferase
VNLLLLEPHELDAAARVVLEDRRAFHLLRVLRVQVGDTVRVGMLAGLQGLGVVESVQSPRVTLSCRLDQPGPAPSDDCLLLAFPRPKVLMRCFEHATALGFGRIVVFRSQRVEKSHLLSHVTAPEVYRAHLQAGLEQSRRTHMPSAQFVGRFSELLENALPTLPSGNRFLADAAAPCEAVHAPYQAAPLVLLVGPEGGLLQPELDALTAHGFNAVRAGTQPLRVEAAISYLAGHLHARRELAAHPRD